MILPENTKFPMGVNRHIFNKEIKNIDLLMGDFITIKIQQRTFKIERTYKIESPGADGLYKVTEIK